MIGNDLKCIPASKKIFRFLERERASDLGLSRCSSGEKSDRESSSRLSRSSSSSSQRSVCPLGCPSCPFTEGRSSFAASYFCAVTVSYCTDEYIILIVIKFLVMMLYRNPTLNVTKSPSVTFLKCINTMLQMMIAPR